MNINSKLFSLIPGIDSDELRFLTTMVEDLDDRQLHTFVSVYNGKRRSPDIILIGAILGLVGIGGVQRFMVNQIGMGILFLLTIGLCYIGTIIDLINYRRLALEYNQKMAYESMQMIKMMG